MAERPFGQYLVTPDGEQWFPVFHLLYYGLVKIAGERYSLLVLINCLGTGVNAFLIYTFFRRHWEPGLALTLSLLYVMAAAHHATAWNAFYFGYLLSLGFLLGALLLTDRYLRAPSGGKLWGIGVCAALSILSHNYPLLGLLALPLYVLLMGERVYLARFLGRCRGSRPGVCHVRHRLFPVCGSERRRQPQFPGIFQPARSRLSPAYFLRRPGVSFPVPVLGSLPLSHPGLHRRDRLVDRKFGGHLVLGRESGQTPGPLGAGRPTFCRSSWSP